MNKNDKS